LFLGKPTTPPLGIINPAFLSMAYVIDGKAGVRAALIWGLA